MPDELGIGATINGAATVTFTSRPYTRLIRSVFVDAGVFASCTIYRAAIQLGGIVAGVPTAHPNTYNVPFYLPAGQALFVVFSASPNPVYLAQAKLSAMRVL